ncbi:MAG: protein kinase [archaeon]|nr:protein kinase [archaeon]
MMEETEVQQVPTKHVSQTFLFQSPNKSHIPLTFVSTADLGEGGFAKVYKVICKEDGKEYALKVMLKEDLLKDKEKKLQTILNEIRIHRQLCHSNICKFELCFEDETNIYIVLEYCPNNSLFQFLKERGSECATEYEIKKYMFDVLKAMIYLNSKHIVHRDLTLQNIFLDKDLNGKLGDFGLSAKINESDEPLTCDRGTPGYIPPDSSFLNNDNIEKLDVFAFGVCIYKLICKSMEVNSFDDKMENFHDIFNHIRNKETANLFSFDKDAHCTDDLFDLLVKRIFVETNQRASFEEIYEHPFFNKGDFPKITLKDLYPEQSTEDRHLNPVARLKDYINKASSKTDITTQFDKKGKPLMMKRKEGFNQKEEELLHKLFKDEEFAKLGGKFYKLHSMNDLLRHYRDQKEKERLAQMKEDVNNANTSTEANPIQQSNSP